MATKELKFKTNLNCSNCVAKVKPDLDSADGILDWKVDTDDKDKILTVESNGITEEEIAAIVKRKGFKIADYNE